MVSLRSLSLLCLLGASALALPYHTEAFAKKFPQFKLVNATRPNPGESRSMWVRNRDSLAIRLHVDRYDSVKEAQDAIWSGLRSPGGYERQTSFSGRYLGEEVWSTLLEADHTSKGPARLLVRRGDRVVTISATVTLSRPNGAQAYGKISLVDLRTLETMALSAMVIPIEGTKPGPKQKGLARPVESTN